METLWRHWSRSAAAALLSILLLDGCAARWSQSRSRIGPHSISVVTLEPAGPTIRYMRFPSGARHFGGLKKYPKLHRWLIDAPCKMGPLVTGLAGDTIHGALRETVLVTFEDTVNVPRFPNPDVRFPRSALVNQLALAEARRMRDTLIAHRAPQYMKDADTLSVRFDGHVLEDFWLIQALQVDLPRDQLQALAMYPAVRSIELRANPVSAPGCNRCDFSTADQNTAQQITDVLAGRQKLGSFPFAGPAYPSSWVALLDMGIRDSHSMICDHVQAFDCSGGDSRCNAGKPEDEDVDGHGTSSAGILTALAQPNNRFQGVSTALLNSYKVYYGTGSHQGELDICAAVRGFQMAVENLDRVVVAEIQDTSLAACSTGGSLESAADNAFAAGLVVIAANGNFGRGCHYIPLSSTCLASPTYRPSVMVSPALARRSLGIGSYTLSNGCCEAGQSWFSTPDERLKPDLQTPTGTLTAANRWTGSGGGANQDDCSTHSFAGTSAATAFAGGVAALLQAVTVAAGDPDPGYVYAMMIMAGTEVGPFDRVGTGASPIDRRELGAGRLRLPSRLVEFAKTTTPFTSAGQEEFHPIDVPSPGVLKVGIWWPEQYVETGGVVQDTHNDIDIELRDATGALRRLSRTGVGVFERITIPVSRPEIGTWHLRISAATIHNSPQEVYWAAGLGP